MEEFYFGLQFQRDIVHNGVEVWQLLAGAGSWQTTSSTTKAEQRANWEWDENIKSQNLLSWCAFSSKLVSPKGSITF